MIRCVPPIFVSTSTQLRFAVIILCVPEKSTSRSRENIWKNGQIVDLNLVKLFPHPELTKSSLKCSQEFLSSKLNSKSPLKINEQKNQLEGETTCWGPNFSGLLLIGTREKANGTKPGRRFSNLECNKNLSVKSFSKIFSHVNLGINQQNLIHLQVRPSS